MMALAHLQRYGHSPIALVGGGTGLIGDPERQDDGAAAADARTGRGERRRHPRRSWRGFSISRAPTNPARLVNNADWLTKLGAIEFMRDVGKHFTVNAMLAKESVKRRIESEDGISYTEFSYSLLQAYDFLELYDRFGCTLQMGGSDQWGNITAGMDLIRRVRGGKAHGLVMPLITTAAGTKFGKTEAGTIWLDPAADAAVRVLSVLAEHRRPRRGHVSEVLHLPRRDADRGARGRDARVSPGASRAACAGAEVTRMVHGDAAVREAEAQRRSCSG